MEIKSTDNWIKEMMQQYCYWQEKWYGKGKKQEEQKKQDKSHQNKPVKYDKKYYQQGMDYCSKKFKECDKYGSKADECRKYYLEKFKGYKEEYEKGSNFNKKKPKDGECSKDKECYKNYQSLQQLLQEVCQKYKNDK